MTTWTYCWDCLESGGEAEMSTWRRFAGEIGAFLRSPRAFLRHKWRGVVDYFTDPTGRRWLERVKRTWIDHGTDAVCHELRDGAHVMILTRDIVLDWSGPDFQKGTVDLCGHTITSASGVRP